MVLTNYREYQFPDTTTRRSTIVLIADDDIHIHYCELSGSYPLNQNAVQRSPAANASAYSVPENPGCLPDNARTALAGASGPDPNVPS